MAKPLLFLLTLALVAVAGGAAAAFLDGQDLPQRQESMAEVIRMSANPAAADPETMHRAAAFMKRELGPFGVVFNALDKVPENSAADVRAKAEAREAAEELLIRHHRQLLLGSDKVTGACELSGRCRSSP